MLKTDYGYKNQLIFEKKSLPSHLNVRRNVGLHCIIGLGGDHPFSLPTIKTKSDSDKHFAAATFIVSLLVAIANKKKEEEKKNSMQALLLL